MDSIRSIISSAALRIGSILPPFLIILSCCTISCLPIGRVEQLEQETAFIKTEVGNIQTKLGDISVNISSDSITTTLFIAGGVALVVAVLSFLTYTTSHRFQFLRDVIGSFKGKCNKNGG